MMKCSSSSAQVQNGTLVLSLLLRILSVSLLSIIFLTFATTTRVTALPIQTKRSTDGSNMTEDMQESSMTRENCASSNLKIGEALLHSQAYLLLLDNNNRICLEDYDTQAELLAYDSMCFMYNRYLESLQIEFEESLNVDLYQNMTTKMHSITCNFWNEVVWNDTKNCTLEGISNMCLKFNIYKYINQSSQVIDNPPEGTLLRSDDMDDCRAHTIFYSALFLIKYVWDKSIGTNPQLLHEPQINTANASMCNLYDQYLQLSHLANQTQSDACVIDTLQKNAHNLMTISCRQFSDWDDCSLNNISKLCITSKYTNYDRLNDMINTLAEIFKGSPYDGTNIEFCQGDDFLQLVSNSELAGKLNKIIDPFFTAKCECEN